MTLFFDFLTEVAFIVYKGLYENIKSAYHKITYALTEAFSKDKFTVYESLVTRK